MLILAVDAVPRVHDALELAVVVEVAERRRRREEDVGDLRVHRPPGRDGPVVVEDVRLAVRVPSICARSSSWPSPSTSPAQMLPARSSLSLNGKPGTRDPLPLNAQMLSEPRPHDDLVLVVPVEIADRRRLEVEAHRRASSGRRCRASPGCCPRRSTRSPFECHA